jgi:hypothetical protein
LGRDIVRRTADRIHAVYNERVRQAAQRDVIYNDDRTMKILALMKNSDNEDDKDEHMRKGMLPPGSCPQAMSERSGYCSLKAGIFPDFFTMPIRLKSSGFQE